jgi:hypothetical protein
MSAVCEAMFGYVTAATILFSRVENGGRCCVQRIKFSPAFALNVQLAAYFYDVLRKIIA